MYEIQESLGHYHILSQLGQGGMGVVYLAKDKRLHRLVAIKRLKQDSRVDGVDEQEKLRRLRQEATALAKLNHPNIVQIYDIIEDQGEFSIVMEYIKGDTLTRHMREKVVDRKQRLVWLKQIADGLDAAHSKGLVHRDLKADNILINEHNVAKITDFGIAKNLHTESTVTTNFVGSYCALSPEQALGLPVDARSDLFSFGMLAFKLLCGQHPFGIMINHNVMVQRILHEPPLDPKVLTPALDIRLIALLKKLMMKNPDHRPGDAKVVSNTLQDIIEKTPNAPDIGENETVDIPLLNVGVEQQHRAGSLRSHRNKMIATLVIMFSIVILAINGFYEPVNSLRVAVLPPVMTKNTGMNENTQQLLTETIIDALQKQILATENLNLVSDQQMELIHGSYQEHAKAVAADILVETILICDAPRCAVQLNRLEPVKSNQDVKLNDWIIKRKESWPILTDKHFLNMESEFQQRLAKIFSERDSKIEFNPLNEEDYKFFIAQRYAILSNGQDTPEMWRLLWQAQSVYQHYLPYYQLMSYLGRLLYDDSGEPLYLSQLKELLNRGEQYKGFADRLLTDHIEVALREQNYDHVASLIKKLQMSGIDKAEQLIYQGLVENFKGNYQQADELYREALSLQPTTAIWYRIANNHFYQGNYSAALDALKSLSEMDRDNFDAKILSALVYLLIGNFNDAISIYRELIEISPKSQFYSNLGIAYELLGDYENAEQLFRKAIEISPNHVPLQLNLADSLALRGETEKAAELYRSVISTSTPYKDDWKMQIIIAQAEMHLGNTMAAIQSVHRSIRLSGDNAEVLYSAALVFSLAEQWPVAITYIQQSIDQGLSPIWYDLPWFDGICGYQRNAVNDLLKMRYIESTEVLEREPRCH